MLQGQMVRREFLPRVPKQPGFVRCALICLGDWMGRPQHIRQEQPGRCMDACEVEGV